MKICFLSDWSLKKSIPISYFLGYVFLWSGDYIPFRTLLLPAEDFTVVRFHIFYPVKHFIWIICCKFQKFKELGNEFLNVEYQYDIWWRCSDLLWEKNVLVIEKNFWNLRRKAENLDFFLRSLEQFIQTVKGQNNFW